MSILITILSYAVICFAFFCITIFMIQILVEPKECPKVPHFLHRTGPFACLGLLGYALVNFNFTYAAIILVNLNQSFLLFILGIVALYVIDTMKIIHGSKLNRSLFIIFYLIGFLNVLIAAIAVSLRLGFNQWWPQLINTCYTFFSVNLSWIFMSYSYFRILKTMIDIDPNYRSELYYTQMRTIKLSILIISLTCILVAIYIFNNIYSMIHNLDQTNAREFDTSIILLGCLLQIIGVLVILWYGWIPFWKENKQETIQPLLQPKNDTRTNSYLSRPETPLDDPNSRPETPIGDMKVVNTLYPTTGGPPPAHHHRAVSPLPYQEDELPDIVYSDSIVQVGSIQQYSLGDDLPTPSCSVVESSSPFSAIAPPISSNNTQVHISGMEET